MTKGLLVLLFLVTSGMAGAHEGGHAHKTAGVGKYGGVLTELTQGGKHRYQAELIRTEDRTVRVYLYDHHGKTLPLAAFAEPARALLQTQHKDRRQEIPFTLTRQKNHFIGKAPKASRKPFTIQVHFKKAGQELTATFENLD